MKYLIDTNTLITAKNAYYAFDICPGFWEWVIKKNEQGVLFSVDKVQEEINKGNDELNIWVNHEVPPGFFIETVGEADDNIGIISDKLQQEDISHHKVSKISDFMGSADCYLVAHAINTDYEIITFEKGDSINSNKIKIPSVCKLFGIKCDTSIFKLLKEDKPKFS